MSMSGLLGEALYVAHKLRYKILVGAPVAMVFGVVAMVVRNWPYHH